MPHHRVQNGLSGNVVIRLSQGISLIVEFPSEAVAVQESAEIVNIFVLLPSENIVRRGGVPVLLGCGACANVFRASQSFCVL